MHIIVAEEYFSYLTAVICVLHNISKPGGGEQQLPQRLGGGDATCQ